MTKDKYEDLKGIEIVIGGEDDSVDPIKDMLKTAKKDWLFYGLTRIAPYFAFLGLALGIGYQKGLIDSMELGNLSGNYDTYEIYYSAVLCVLNIFSSLNKIDVWEIFKSSSFLIVLFTVLGAFFPFLVKMSIQFKDNGSEYNQRIKSRISRVIDSNSLSALLSTTVGALLGTLASLIVTASSFVILSFLVFLLLPWVVGYKSGEYSANKYIEKPSCITLEGKAKVDKTLHGCQTQTINGKTIKAEVVLETPGGYFLWLSDAFAYVSKDGGRCTASKFKEIKAGSNYEDFEFPKSQVDEFCSSDGLVYGGSAEP